MGTTVENGFPYPEPTDLARNGSLAVRQLAESLDAHLARTWADGVGLGTTAPLAQATLVPLTYSSMTVDGFAHNGIAGADTFTYTGTSGRWHMVSFGANIFSTGTTPGQSELFLQRNGFDVTTLVHGANSAHLGGCISLTLQFNDTLRLVGRVFAGSGGSGGTYRDAWLRAVSVP